MLGWRVPAPNEALLVSGGNVAADGLPFKIVTGRGAFVLPVRRSAYFLTLSMQEAEVAEPCVSNQGITLQVRAVIAFKVGDDHQSIANAARRFLDDQASMPKLVGRIFAGHLRAIVGSMTVEDIIRERQKLASEVLGASKPEMATLGLVVDSFQIESISDDSGYITALSQPHVAAVNQAARIAQARADQAAAEAQQASARAQAQYEQETALKRAELQAQTDAAQRRAAQSGPLAEAQATQEVLREQAKVADARAELTRRELQAEVIAPAEAEARKVEITAEADATAARLVAEATATHGGIILQRMLVEQYPEVARAVASELGNAHITLFDGAKGLSSLTAGLIGQGGSVFEALRQLVSPSAPAVVGPANGEGGDGAQAGPVGGGRRVTTS